MDWPTEKEWTMKRENMLLRRALIESEGQRLHLSMALITREIEEHGEVYVPPPPAPE